MKRLEGVGKHIRESINDLFNPNQQPVIIAEVYYGLGIQIPREDKIPQLKAFLQPIVVTTGCRLIETVRPTTSMPSIGFEDASALLGLAIVKGKQQSAGDFLKALDSIQKAINDTLEQKLIKESDLLYPLVSAAKTTILEEFNRRSSTKA